MWTTVRVPAGGGTTPQEAVTEVLRARDAWLDVARQTGRDVPPPRYRPAIYAS